MEPAYGFSTIIKCTFDEFLKAKLETVELRNKPWGKWELWTPIRSLLYQCNVNVPSGKERNNLSVVTWAEKNVEDLVEFSPLEIMQQSN